MSRYVTVCVAMLVVSSCASRLLELPDGLGKPPGEGAVDQMLAIFNGCGQYEAGSPEPWVADVSVRGVAGGIKVDRHLKVAFDASLSGRIESVPASGSRSSFLLVNSPEKNATLLLDDKTRVVSEPFPAMFDAIAGVQMDATGLGNLMRGCYFLEPPGWFRTHGDEWLVAAGGRNGRMYFNRAVGEPWWRMISLFYPGDGLQPAWRIDYRDFHEGVARTLVVEGLDGRQLSLEIRLSGVTLSPSLPTELFQATIPAASRPIPLDAIDVPRFLRGVAE